MQLMNRISYAFISACFGALIGVAGWWLYGTAHSLNYDGPEMAPVLRHWLRWTVITYGCLGFWLQHHAAEVVADTFAAIFHFEINDAPDRAARLALSLVFCAICLAAIWFTARG